ncbi:MAG: 4Fe-4S ferredoxin [Deltaproteobacteria bacterium HGW-Deltaproteobacteria-19]|nr:MAG: 4Fe-4S ferredoxin [Deltaproteobacteria bacterium HGW-Deltaproteobacteria-19]
MTNDVYAQLAKVLDTLPNGFPRTDSGVEIKLLKRIFTPAQAELFGRLRLTFETVEEIAARNGMPVEGLKGALMGMAVRGQVFTIKPGGVRRFRMLPWVFGIYEFQLDSMDREFAELNEEYWPYLSKQFFSDTPQLMQTLSVEETVPSHQEALPYEKVSAIIEKGRSFMVNECICKKEQGLLGKPCDRPVHVCLGISLEPGVFEKTPSARILTKEEACALLKMTEDAGLVHLTGNVQTGHYYICNCCKCCCGVLRSINEFGVPASRAVNSHHYAVIDADLCTGCGICTDSRCQVGAVVEEGDAYRVVRERCIGCGLCVTACPMEAIRLVRKEREEIDVPPLAEDTWFDERGRRRGVDFSTYK